MSLVDRPARVAARLVMLILADLADRRGLRQEWQAMDAAVRSEIVDAWEELAEEVMADLLEDEKEGA